MNFFNFTCQKLYIPGKNICLLGKQKYMLEKRQIGKIHLVVIKLMNDFLDQGRVLCTNN